MSRSTKRFWLQALAIAIIANITLPLVGSAADRITAHYPPFKDVSISVRDLEAFAKDGKIPADYTALAKQAAPAQLQQFRQLLQQRLEFSPTYTAVCMFMRDNSSSGQTNCEDEQD